MRNILDSRILRHQPPVGVIRLAAVTACAQNWRSREDYDSSRTSKSRTQPTGSLESCLVGSVRSTPERSVRKHWNAHGAIDAKASAGPPTVRTPWRLLSNGHGRGAAFGRLRQPLTSV